MKKTCAIIGVFVFTFIFAAGSIGPSYEAQAAERLCHYNFPCFIDDMVCTVKPCIGTCWYGIGYEFYCIQDLNWPYCSKDFYYPIPCYTISQ
jgi:hypothetical protein